MRPWILCCVLLLLVISGQVVAQVQLRVDIQGLDRVLEENVRLFLSIEQQKYSDLLSEGRMQRLHKKAIQEIKNALQPFGFYKPTIKAELNKIDREFWQASYVIDPGKAIHVEIFDLQIDQALSEDQAFIDLLKNFELTKGSLFNHLEYEKIKAELARLASERGYFNAQFTLNKVEIDLLNYQANVYLHFAGGPRFHFGEVGFSKTVLDESLLHRYVPFKQGDPYTLNGLIELQQALNDSDFFYIAEVTSGQANTDLLEVPVEVVLKPRKKHRFTLGLGYGTDTGARSKFGWQIPRLNKKGHKINTHVDVSELGYNFGSQYSLPVLNPRTDQIIYSAAVVNEKTDTSESTIETLSTSLNHRRGKWRESLSLSYQQEAFTVADITGDTTLLMPGMSWSRVWGSEFWGNKLFKVFDGVRLNLGLRLASENFLSDVNFSQYNGSVKAIHRFNARHRFITRGKLGYIETSQFEDLPTSVRFFAGGAQSVRGYRYQSLGPLDDNDDVTGGQYLLEGSVEYEYSFNERWGLALFVDAGNAVNDLNDKLEQGAGFGLRWQSPVGPVRIDLASAITSDGDPWRLHINIGPDL